MRIPFSPPSIASLLACTLIPALPAQWVTFQDQTSTRLVAAANLGSADPQEKDYAWADFDQDGDIDLAVARKQPFTTPGKYPNVLFMNEGGVLTDRTAALASASTVPGSQGMLDATNDRDIVAVDVNGDGWIDLVTATTLTAGDPQYIRVPRVYINRGNDIAGNWLGFLYDDPLRINDMQPGASWMGYQRFCSVAAGDIDHDGDMDLYFGDYQQGGTRPIDVDDRLLLNDGTGYFTDVSTARMTYQMLESSFAMKVAMVDMNLDGFVDILKDDALNAPQQVSISYNNPANPGFFNVYQEAYGNAPYHFAVGDLNNDNLPDMIFSDDGQDRYKLHAGVSGGVATFGGEIAFTYSGGGADDGFGGNNLIVDLNNDGWKDVIIADADVDIAGCSRRCHIFHNLGNAPNVTLREELVSGAMGGIPTSMLSGTFDVAVFDINGDGWNDMVIGRCSGTTVWINQPPAGVSFTYPGGLPSFISPGSIRTVDVQATGLGAIVPQPASATLYYSVNGTPFTTSPMTSLGGGLFRATLPQLPVCTDGLRFYFSVQDQNSTTYNDPPLAPVATHTAVAAVGTTVIYENNFEGSTTGWTVSNSGLTTGAWQVATPVGTTVLAEFAAPPEDAEASTSSTRCFVTQNGSVGGAANAADVDGGPTDLISPPINMAGTDGFISYRRWFYCSNNNDNLTVSVSPDNVNWTPVEVVTGPGQNQWTTFSFKVSNYITPSNQVRVRFRTSDSPDDSITEAGIDVFRAEVFSCTLCQATFNLATNGTATMSMCGGDLSPGTSTTLAIVGMPAFGNGLLVFDFLLSPTPWMGGTLISPAPVILGPIFVDGTGGLSLPLPIGGLLPHGFNLFSQTAYVDPGLPFGVGQTNAVIVHW
ncbi:MAG TPA: FG-GAP-like repeat-containing protein [Planctomycetota bacterium]|nr:FG-GAP-like repeat-containing protein [Planctomycetota bacterium]